MKITEVTGPGVGTWLTESLSAWGINTLTDVQVRALSAGVANGQGMVVSAPTSSGKTLIGEIAVLRALREKTRAIYLVSHKALADQKYKDFNLRFGESAKEPIASVGLNTGDRVEGDIDAQLVVATYEKALGLVLSGQLDPANALVVADELQIIGETGRGPEIEALCALLKKRGIKQFVALTATVENPEDLAGWMECKLVRSTYRDVPLYQEIWYRGRAHRTTFGQEQGEEIPKPFSPASDVKSVVGQLLQLGRGPVLVFTESRREAAKFANEFCQNRTKVVDGIALAQQLDLFSEPTESSDQLKENAACGVTFHSADLAPQERQIIEDGFTQSRFEACFATSTLAAGVNFPFRTIVFPKLTYEWGPRAGSHILRSDYRNMSGRAGRLGMHEDGFAVLLPQNAVELAHANSLVRPENDRLVSQLVSISLRKTVLFLIAGRMAASFEEIMSFFRNTLYWYQILERNPGKLKALEDESKLAVKWLAKNALIEEATEGLMPTPLGVAAASTGLLPPTAVELVGLLEQLKDELTHSFDKCVPGLIYAACSCAEFRGEKPTRFFPFASISHDSVAFWSGQTLPVKLDRTDTQLAQAAHAILLYVDGRAERKIAYETKISAGQIHRLALDIAWIFEGLHKLACIPDVDLPQTASNNIAMLARRVRWGATAEALDVLRIAERHGVPGFGRQRAMALITQGIATVHDILNTTKEKLVLLLRDDRRAQALCDAASNAMGHGPDRLVTSHLHFAKSLGLENLVERCNREIGVPYERAIQDLLTVETSWAITVLDDGKRQNEPDFLLQLGDLNVIVECKTCTKNPPLIKKEDAWAVLQKAANYDKGMKRVTLGKPAFDETCKKKVAGSADITLVEHNLFIEGLLRVHAGRVTPDEFLRWLSTPGLTEFERLTGTPTFES